MLYKVSLSSVIFLPLILGVGFVTAYEDIKSSRIDNKWIIAGLAYSFLAYSAIGAFFALSSHKIFPAVWSNAVFYLVMNLDKWAINLLFSTLTAYLLWHFKMWGAGDAKLFICYAALIPIGQYSRFYFSGYFASFLLLLAIFIPATVFLFLRAAVYFIKRFDAGKTREMAVGFIKAKLVKSEAARSGKVILGFFIFLLFFRILAVILAGSISKFLPNWDILLVVSLFGFRQLSRFFRRHADIMVAVFIASIAFIACKALYLREGFILEMGGLLRSVLVLMILLPLFRKVTDLYVEATARETTPFALWMFVGALLVWFI